MTAAGAIAALALCAALLAGSGCTLGWVRTGHPLAPGAAALVEVGQAKAHVLRALGPPDRVSIDRDESLFEYSYATENERKLDVSILRASGSYEDAVMREDRLVVRFDAAGKVIEKAIVRQSDAP